MLGRMGLGINRSSIPSAPSSTASVASNVSASGSAAEDSEDWIEISPSDVFSRGYIELPPGVLGDDEDEDENAMNEVSSHQNNRSNHFQDRHEEEEEEEDDNDKLNKSTSSQASTTSTGSSAIAKANMHLYPNGYTYKKGDSSVQSSTSSSLATSPILPRKNVVRLNTGDANNYINNNNAHNTNTTNNNNHNNPASAHSTSTSISSGGSSNKNKSNSARNQSHSREKSVDSINGMTHSTMSASATMSSSSSTNSLGASASNLNVSNSHVSNNVSGNQRGSTISIASSVATVVSALSSAIVPKCTQSGGKTIREGNLKKLGYLWRRRWFVLTSTNLFYFTDGSRNPTDMVSLDQISAVNFKFEDIYKHCLIELIMRSGAKWYLCGDTAEDTESWLGVIQLCVALAHRRILKEQRKASSNSAYMAANPSAGAASANILISSQLTSSSGGNSSDSSVSSGGNHFGSHLNHVSQPPPSLQNSRPFPGTIPAASTAAANHQIHGSPSIAIKSGQQSMKNHIGARKNDGSDDAYEIEDAAAAAAPSNSLALSFGFDFEGMAHLNISQGRHVHNAIHKSSNSNSSYTSPVLNAVSPSSTVQNSLTSGGGLAMPYIAPPNSHIVDYSIGKQQQQQSTDGPNLSASLSVGGLIRSSNGLDQRPLKTFPSTPKFLVGGDDLSDSSSIDSRLSRSNTNESRGPPSNHLVRSDSVLSEEHTPRPLPPLPHGYDDIDLDALDEHSIGIVEDETGSLRYEYRGNFTPVDRSRSTSSVSTGTGQSNAGTDSGGGLNSSLSLADQASSTAKTSKENVSRSTERNKNRAIATASGEHFATEVANSAAARTNSSLRSDFAPGSVNLLLPEYERDLEVDDLIEFDILPFKTGVVPLPTIFLDELGLSILRDLCAKDNESTLAQVNGFLSTIASMVASSASKQQTSSVSERALRDTLFKLGAPEQKCVDFSEYRFMYHVLLTKPQTVRVCNLFQFRAMTGTCEWRGYFFLL